MAPVGEPELCYLRPVLYQHTETVQSKPEPVFFCFVIFSPSGGHEDAPILPLPQQPSLLLPRQAGTRGDQAAPPKQACETKKDPGRTAGRTPPRGERNQPPGTVAARVSPLEVSGLTLLLHDLSSLAFWTFPPAPSPRPAVGGRF